MHTDYLGEFCRIDLDPDHRFALQFMEASPELPKSDRTEVALDALDAPDPLDGHPGSNWKAAAEAGKAGLAPDGQIVVSGNLTDVGLGDARLDQRVAHLILTGSH